MKTKIVQQSILPVGKKVWKNPTLEIIDQGIINSGTNINSAEGSVAASMVAVYHS